MQLPQTYIQQLLGDRYQGKPAASVPVPVPTFRSEIVRYVKGVLIGLAVLFCVTVGVFTFALIDNAHPEWAQERAATRLATQQAEQAAAKAARLAQGFTPEREAMIAAYKAEEKLYYETIRQCGELVIAYNGGTALRGGPDCHKDRNQVADIMTKHARWTIARGKKFGEKYDAEAQWIVAHAD
jgi:hypothetical protein